MRVTITTSNHADYRLRCRMNHPACRKEMITYESNKKQITYTTCRSENSLNPLLSYYLNPLDSNGISKNQNFNLNIKIFPCLFSHLFAIALRFEI